MTTVQVDVNVLQQLISAALKAGNSGASGAPSGSVPGTVLSMAGSPATGDVPALELGVGGEGSDECVGSAVYVGPEDVGPERAESESGGSDDSVTFKVVRPELQASVKRLHFGAALESTGDTQGYFRAIRNPRTKALCEAVSKFAGVKLNKNIRERLGLASYAAGSMPACIANGRDRLKSLAIVGDAMLDFQQVSCTWQTGAMCEKVQAAKGRVTDAELCRLAHSSGLIHALVVPAGVDLRQGKTVATFFEAIVGALSLDLSLAEVNNFLYKVGMQFD